MSETLTLEHGSTTVAAAAAEPAFRVTGVRGRETVTRLVLVAADAVAAIVTLVLVAVLTAHPSALKLIAIAPAIVVLKKLAGAYDRDGAVIGKSTLDELPKLLQISGLFTLLVWLWDTAVADSDYAATAVIGLWATMFALTFASRLIARRVIRTLCGVERCLVIGTPARVEEIRRKLSAAQVVGHVDLEGYAAELHELQALVDEHGAQRIILAPADTGDRAVTDLIRVARAAHVRVSVLPPMLGVVGTTFAFDQVDGLTMIGVDGFGLSRSAQLTKRAFDLTVAGLMLVAVLPVLAAVALAVRLDSRGSILFRQTRVGRDGEHFEIFKFRSMVVDAEARKSELRHLNETEGLFKIADDPRITRVGRFIRSTALDELPQLFNVLRGEMSLVGPRPLVIDEDDQVSGLDRARLHITPGMTGHWQILGSARVPLHEMVAIDYAYVANWSLWADIKILLRTTRYMLGRGGV
jgi:exopolysaccharide biosynthesis polyprenyl glycosylphosphotransferase